MMERHKSAKGEAPRGSRPAFVIGSGPPRPGSGVQVPNPRKKLLPIINSADLNLNREFSCFVTEPNGEIRSG